MPPTPIDYLGQTVYKWEAGASTFLASPERGARLMNWNITMADGSVRDVIHWPELAELGPGGFARVHGGNPVLFPFCARTYAKGQIGFWMDGKVRRPMPVHGFARDCTFSVEELEANRFTAVLVPSEEAREAYPFDYEFSVLYQFRELSLAVEFRLENRCETKIPWSAGHHFYFQLPWNPGARREDYQIDVPAKKAWYPAGDGRLVADEGFPKRDVFSSPKLSERIYTHLKSNAVTFGPKSGEEDVTVRVGALPVPEAGAAVVTWTESEESPYYCVQPWMGPPNSPEHKRGLHWVEPGHREAFSVEVSLV